MKWTRYWHLHPAVPTGKELSIGERAADGMRNGMGSWPFVFGALAFLAAWMLHNSRHGFDPYPFILLNLVLSCLAALQGAILLIAAKRQDQIASSLANHNYQTNREALDILKRLERLERQHLEQTRLLLTMGSATGSEPLQITEFASSRSSRIPPADGHV
jgi:uncharacterized membrane protein